MVAEMYMLAVVLRFVGECEEVRSERSSQEQRVKEEQES